MKRFNANVRKYAAPAHPALTAFAHPCVSSANVCFYGSENNETQDCKIPRGKRFDASAAFSFHCPLSVASKSVTCQGKTHRDVRFSMDKPGWRIHAALKQGTLFEGSPGSFPGPTRPGCIFLVTSFVQAKEVTRHSGEIGNFKTRRTIRKQASSMLMEYPLGQ